MSYDYFKRSDANPWKGPDYSSDLVKYVRENIPADYTLRHTISDLAIGTFGRLDEKRVFFFLNFNKNSFLGRTNYSHLYTGIFTVLEEDSQKHFHVVYKFSHEDRNDEIRTTITTGTLIKEELLHQHLKDCEGTASGGFFLSYDNNKYFLVMHRYPRDAYNLSYSLKTTQTDFFNLTKSAFKWTTGVLQKDIYPPDIKPGNYLVNETLSLALSDFGSFLYLQTPDKLDRNFLSTLVEKFGQSSILSSSFKSDMETWMNQFEVLSDQEQLRFCFYCTTIGTFDVISTLYTSDKGTHDRIDSLIKGFKYRQVESATQAIQSLIELMKIQIAHQLAASILAMSSVVLSEQLVKTRKPGFYVDPENINTNTTPVPLQKNHPLMINDPLGSERVTEYLKARGITNTSFIDFFNSLLDPDKPKTDLAKYSKYLTQFS